MPSADDQPKPPHSKPQSIHAPWRMSYMDMLTAQRRSEETEPLAGAVPEQTKVACFLRDYWLSPDQDQSNHIIVRTGTESQHSGGLILLNKYPYSNGHLLVCLGESRPRLLDYSEAQRAELWSLTDLAVRLVELALNPQGVNVGVNQGAAAGAGVPEHVHVHVVPRWAGDVNFMSVVAQIRVIPSALDAMARRMSEVWEGVREGTRN